MSTDDADIVTMLPVQHSAAEPRVLMLAGVHGATDALMCLIGILLRLFTITLTKPSGHMLMLSSVFLVTVGLSTCVPFDIGQYRPVETDCSLLTVLEVMTWLMTVCDGTQCA